jgi:hypothetical protein
MSLCTHLVSTKLAAVGIMAGQDLAAQQQHCWHDATASQKAPPSASHRAPCVYLRMTDAFDTLMINTIFTMNGACAPEASSSCCKRLLVALHAR